MARWSSRTLLAPDDWARLVGFDPCLWAGVQHDAARGCDLWYQQPWQSEPVRAGRETVGQAVLAAERKLAAQLGFFVAPAYVAGEELAWPRSGTEVALRHGYVQAIGVEARATLHAGAAVVYGDPYGGSWEDDTATITVAVPDGTDPCEVAVYYPGQVSASEIRPLDETWRIRPLTVTVAGGVATITGHRCQFVQWSHQRLGEVVPDIADDSYFMAEVDVYRRYTDPQGSVAVWHDDRDCAAGCDELTQDVCGRVTHGRLGHVRLAPATYSDGTWTATGWQYRARPDLARVCYLAGYRDDADPACDAWGDLGEVVAKLSLTFLREDVCQCDAFAFLWAGARAKLDVLTRDLASAYNAFGSQMAGALDAWTWCRDHRLSRRRVR